jgi:DNA processing protein
VNSALISWLRLSLTPGLGNQGARKLLAALGLPEAIFAADARALAQVVSPKVAAAVMQLPPNFAEQWAHTQAWLEGSSREAGGVQRRIVTLGDAAYPAALLEMEDPPLLLYLLGAGDLAALDMRKCVAMVGSRNPTQQGADNARQFAKALVGAGLTVVSGLALGVDGAAHEGALLAEEGGANGLTNPHAVRTVAVVGTGLDRVYPKQHFDLAHRIAARGVLVSEYPLGMPPLSNNFPRRNRIIAGLSRATLVVEAALKSGSLITARLASEQGRDVFAIPGSIHAAQSRGCHALIKQGAKLVECAQDVLEEFDGRGGVATMQQTDTAKVIAVSAYRTGANSSKTINSNVKTTLESAVLTALGFDPTGLDALQARTGLPTAQLQGELLELELDGHVARLPGGLFQRLGRA